MLDHERAGLGAAGRHLAHQRHVHCCAAQAPETAEPRKKATATSRKKPKRRVDGWENAREFKEGGMVHEGAVRGVNKGGILIDCWGVTGFIPNSMLVSATARPEEGMTVKAMFVEVDELSNRMILSQKHVYQAQLLASLSPGDEVEGTIAWLESYGAFVDVQMAGGQTLSGLVHTSELSWSRVIVPDTVVSVGEWVKCKVTSTEPSRGRLNLSIKQTQPDPLEQNVETVLPPSMDEESVEWKDAEEPLAGLHEVTQQLLQVDGISDVKYGRQAELPGHVSQDLELWLSREQVHDHWNVVARSMSAVQELAVFSSLDKAELKACFDRATRAISSSSESEA